MMFSIPMAITDSNAEYMPDLEDIVSVTYNGATRFVCGDVYARTDDGYELDIFEHNEAIYQTGPIPARVSSLVGAIGEVDPVSVPQQAITAFEVSELAREAASTAAGKVNPGKYLGVVTATPASKNNPQITVAKGPTTGYVTATANDYFLFSTAGISGWANGYLYQWSGSEWARLATETNTTKYLEAINDITSNAPPGIFSDVFCKMLFAQQAAINTLESELIQVKNAIFGGARFTKSDDGKSVVDNGADKPGFKLGADGRFIASNADIGGTINAMDGNFTGSITPVKGIFNSWYWGVATNKTQKDWFDIFESRITVGKRLNTFGGARLYNPAIKEWTDNVMSFIERLDNDTIEINAFPINTTKRDFLTIVSCARGNNSIISASFYFGW
jgi:hypothetical protein